MGTRLSKHEIIELIDLIIFKATGGLFTGDERDGDAPRITFQNFHSEKTRLGAQALRARLSRLSPTEVAEPAAHGPKPVDLVCLCKAAAVIEIV